MTLRGTFRGGVIIPDQVNGLRNGDVVEIVTERRSRSGSAKPARREVRRPNTLKAERVTATRKSQAKKARLFGFGMLKDKAEWRGRTGGEIARELRVRASRRTARATQ